MVRDDLMKKDGLSPHVVNLGQMDKYETAADDRVEKMSDAEYDSCEKKADAYEEREELFDYMRTDALKEKNIDPAKSSEPEMIVAAKTAETRLAGLSDAQVHDKLKAANSQAAEEFKAKMDEVAKKHSSNSGSGDKTESPSGGLLGFGIALGLVVLLWLMLPTIVAMCLAYKVAANA